MASAIAKIFLSYSFYKWVGVFVVAVRLLKLADILVQLLYRRVRNYCGFGFSWKNLGKWAVVTGGTDGIGKAYAEELAMKGFSVCLISRNISKLNCVAEDLEQNYQVTTKIINSDFTQGPEIYDEIHKQLKELDGGIGVLVNNVGMSYKYAEHFHAIPGGLQVMWDMINSNITSCTMMMRMVMPMMENKGVIINVSSLTALYPLPLLASYAACKAYVYDLSRAVQYEYKNTKFIIQCVLPAYVATKMSNRRASLGIPSAKTFVSSAITTVGVEDCTYGYFPHKVRGFIHQWLKDNMPAWVNFAISMHFMQKSRDRYNRKFKKINQE